MTKWNTNTLSAPHTQRHLDACGPTAGKLYLIRGVPGSGKSTYAGQLYEAGEVDLIFEADQFRYNHRGEYIFDPTKTAECHQKCFEATKAAILAGKNVAVANTFCRHWEMSRYLDIGASKVVVVRMNYSYPNEHSVPAEVIEGMRDRFEPFGGEHVFS